MGHPNRVRAKKPSISQGATASILLRVLADDASSGTGSQYRKSKKAKKVHHALRVCLSMKVSFVRVFMFKVAGTSQVCTLHVAEPAAWGYTIITGYSSCTQ